MTKKPDYDLSNPGGRPKDWLQRGREYDAEFSGWGHYKAMALGAVALLLVVVTVGSLLWGGFRLLVE